MKRKDSPITMEMFEDALLPRIEEVFENRIKVYQEEVVGFKVEVLGEIQKLREEVAVVNHQYERTNKRVDKIAKKLNLNV